MRDEKLIEKQKEEAASRMKKLKLHENVIKEFTEKGKLNVSELQGLLYWLDDSEKEMVKRFEDKNDAIVYHIIKNRTSMGVMYSLLYVSKYEEEWEMDNEELKEGYPLVYVVNNTYPDCSEFGSIEIKILNGGLVRTA